MCGEEVKNVVIDHQLKEQSEDKYGYKNEPINYVSQGQIMVTITLAEYRSLVKSNAEKEVSEARSKTYEVQRERDELKKEVADLRKQLSDLRQMIASAATINATVIQAKDEDNV